MTSETASTPTEKEAVNATPDTKQPTGDAVKAPASEAKDKAPESKQPQTEAPKKEPTAADKVLGALEKKAEPQGAPEKYEAWKLPEGVTLADGVNEAFTDMARKAGLNQKDAQSQLERLVTAHQEQTQALLRKQVDGWGEQLVKDPEIGGDKLESETMPAVARALTAYDSDGSLRELLLSGLGTHPALVRVLAKVGRAVGETTELVTGQRSAPAVGTAKALYDATAV